MKAITKVKSYRKMNPHHRKFAEGSPVVESQRRSLLQDAPPPPPVFPLDQTLYNGAQEPPYPRVVCTSICALCCQLRTGTMPRLPMPLNVQSGFTCQRRQDNGRL